MEAQKQVTTDSEGCRALYFAARDGEGCSALYIAARDGDEVKCRLLLDSAEVKEQLEAGRSDGAPPLFAAAVSGHLGITQMLLRAGASVSNATDRGALHIAAAYDHSAVVRELVKAGADMGLCWGGLGGTPLYHAAEAGRLDAVNALLDAGADRDGGSSDVTPLFMAACRGHTHIVKRLLDAGADADQSFVNTFPAGATPLYMAADQGHAGVIEALLDAGAHIDKVCGDTTPLWAAARSGRADAVEALLKKGADKDWASARWGTPMYAAAQNGHWDVVLALVQNSADKEKSVTALGGATPLHAAAQHGQYDAVMVLLDFAPRVDVNKADKDGATPLFMAAKGGHLDIVKQLLMNHADGNLGVTDGTTPVIAAASGGHDEITRALVQVRVNVNAADGQGRTALHFAASKGNMEMTQLLYSHGANPLANSGVEQLPMDVVPKGPEGEALRRYLAKAANAAQLVRSDGLQGVLASISIVAVLVVTVTFIGFLSPPGAPSDGGLVKLLAEGEKVPLLNNAALRAFFVLNGFALLWAAADLLLVLCFTLPGISSRYRGADNVSWVWLIVVSCSGLLALAVVSSVGAFLAAGFAVLPREEYWIMILLSIFGGAILAATLAALVYFVAEAAGPNTGQFMARFLGVSLWCKGSDDRVGDISHEMRMPQYLCASMRDLMEAASR